jgi:hypothetical protein
MNGRLLVREDQEAAMDCEHAREQLDAARPDFPDREDSELQAAFEHLDGCPACAEVYEFRRAFDRRMRTVVRQVEIPSDLQTRLKALVTTEAEPVRPSNSDAANARPGARTSRRAALLATSAAALLMATGWFWFVNHQTPAPLLSATVLNWWQERLSAPGGFSLASLQEFNGQFKPTVADGRWQSQVTGAAPRGIDFDDDGRQDGAVFSLKGGGFLVVLPPGRVSDPPSAASAVSAISRYAPAPHVAWTQGGSMHICYLPGGSPDDLQRLLNAVNRAA